MATKTNPKPNGLFDKTEASALAKGNEFPSGPLTQIEELQQAWRSLEGRVNIVSPVAIVDTIPALHGISLRAVLIDPSTNTYGQGPEVYRDARFCEKDEVALGGVALQKIAAAAGVQIISRNRLDDRRDPSYCEVELTIGVRDFDGTWRQVTKAKEVDFRDGSPETMKPERINNEKTGRLVPLEASALADKRRHIQSLAETKAFYRALRTILAIKQKYTKAELAKPFVVPKLVPALDPADPDQKRALIDMAVGREAALYGPGPRAGEPVRTLKDATPTRAAAVAQAGGEPACQHGFIGACAECDGAGQQPDFELLDFPEETPHPAAVCGCPCSCQAELTEEVAHIGIERIGTARCRECYPSKSFDIAKHRDVGDLEIPKMPGLTAARVAAGLKVKR